MCHTIATSIIVPTIIVGLLGASTLLASQWTSYRRFNGPRRRTAGSGRPPTGPPPIPLPADTAVALPPEANGRRTRWTINQSSLQTLEAIFQHEQFPSQQLRTQLGAHLGVSPRQVQVWFQNRRQRERKEGAATAAAAAGCGIDRAALPAAPAAAAAPEPRRAGRAGAGRGGGGVERLRADVRRRHRTRRPRRRRRRPRSRGGHVARDADAADAAVGGSRRRAPTPTPTPSPGRCRSSVRCRRSPPSARVYDGCGARGGGGGARARARAQARAAAAAAAAQAAETPEEDAAATEAATAAAMSAAAATVAALRRRRARRLLHRLARAPTTSLEGARRSTRRRLSKRMQLSARPARRPRGRGARALRASSRPSLPIPTPPRARPSSATLAVCQRANTRRPARVDRRALSGQLDAAVVPAGSRTGGSAKSANPGCGARAPRRPSPAIAPGGLTRPGMPETAVAVLAAANNPGARPLGRAGGAASPRRRKKDLVPGATSRTMPSTRRSPTTTRAVGPISPPQGFFDGREVICRMPWCVTPRSMLWLS